MSSKIEKWPGIFLRPGLLNYSYSKMVFNCPDVEVCDCKITENTYVTRAERQELRPTSMKSKRV